MIMSGTPPSPLPAVPLLRKPGLFGWPLSQIKTRCAAAARFGRALQSRRTV